jgi:regulation of enolase protein 1 (concanavalin A-like superfamily)
MMRTLTLAFGVIVCLAFAATVRPQVSPLPSGWSSLDIGAVGQRGSASANAGTFTVSGAGADVWGTADAFHFAYRPLTGDGTITAEVATIVGSQAWTKMGVMIRGGTQAGAAHAFMLVSSGKGLAFQRRTTSGGLTTSTSGGAGTAPRWVRLTRAGTVIRAYVSGDGQTWTQVGSDTFSMPGTVLAGLAAHSHDPTRLATATFTHVSVTAAPVTGPWSAGRLQVAPNGRFLQHGTRHFFYLADTAWGLFKRLDRAQADAYLRDCVAKRLNAVQAVALFGWNSSTAPNAYGDHPLVRVDGRYDPAQPLTTPGTDPADPIAYDFWDHVDYVVGRAAALGLSVILEPTWGYFVSGTNSYAYDMSSNVFTVANARAYGEFLGKRYGSRPNVIWMLGGDRAAVYANGDFRPVWRSMAEGIGRGASGQPVVWSEPHTGWNQIVLTYHATRRENPGSSIWFHTDPWLDYNGVQAEYHAITGKLASDWRKTPPKPTAIVESRYEDDYATNGVFVTGAFKQRTQLYHALLAGAAGYAYGHSRIWDFSRTDKTWQMALDDPGRRAMATVWSLLSAFSSAQLLGRVPDQGLIDGSLGSGKTEDLLVATRGGDGRFALVYSTNGRDIRLVASKLAPGTADAYWFSPRTGALVNSAGSTSSTPFARFPSGAGAPVTVLNPPGSPGPDNDWMLRVIVR